MTYLDFDRVRRLAGLVGLGEIEWAYAVKEQGPAYQGIEHVNC